MLGVKNSPGRPIRGRWTKTARIVAPMSETPAHAVAEVVAQVRDQVVRRRPVDDRERASQTAFVQHLDVLDRPFDESADRVHVTGSAIVVGKRGVVLHKHKRLGLWLQPGGHIEAGETPWDAALREAHEETGLDVSFPADGPRLVHVDVHAGGRKHIHLDLRYVLDAPDVTPTPPAGESQEVRWFPWYKAIAIADAGLEGVLRSLQPGQPTLRPARGNDASDCASVYLRSRRFALPDVPVVHDDSDVRRWMADEVIAHADVTVAEVDGLVVGLMVLDGDAKRRSGWIEQLYLDPSWMGRGLGAQFVERAKTAQPDGLQLWTFQANAPAQRFYERLGFVEVERTDGAGNEERSPDVRYQWLPGADQ
ncbi:MAG: putative hydrolase [Ilumatobacteraceae bacterium]|nr:putative hydrolase [Ilumatobacteraceae bacterium]